MKLLLIYTACATAVLPLLYLSVKMVWAVLSVQRWKQNSVEAKARILYVTVMNERNRSVPFAQLKVEVFARNGEPFIANAEGFYSQDELYGLKAGSIVRVRYQPGEKTDLQIIKTPLEITKSSRLFVKQGGELVRKKVSVRDHEARHSLLLPH